MGQHDYVGFWVRFWAVLIDGFLITGITVLLNSLIAGQLYFAGGIGMPWELLTVYLIPAAITIWFWRRYRATPGKMFMGIEVVDEKTRSAVTLEQGVGRYLSYYLSALPLALGYIWAAFDPKKQSWHDKLAGTIVVYKAKHDGLNTDEG